MIKLSKKQFITIIILHAGINLYIYTLEIQMIYHKLGILSNVFAKFYLVRANNLKI